MDTLATRTRIPSPTGPLGQLFSSPNHYVSFPKASVILMQGGDLDKVFLIQKGLVKVSDIDEKGEKRTIALLTRNNIFPLAWVFARLPKEGALYFYEAITETQCYVADMEMVRRSVRSSQKLTWQIMDFLAKSYYNAAARIKNLQKSDAVERLEFILYYLAILIGRNRGDDIYVIDTPVTQQEIADLAGLSRESVSRHLNEMKQKRIYFKKKDRAFVDMRQLDIDAMPKVFRLAAV